MKWPAIVLGIILSAATACAQSDISEPQRPVAIGIPVGSVAPTRATQTLTLFADAAPGGAIAAAAAALPAVSDPAPAGGQSVIGVRPTYDWQLYGGYTFFNFYEIPNLTNTENGFDIDVAFYPHAGWIGAEGMLMATFGSQAGFTSKFTLAAGGVRLRWQKSDGLQLFLHGAVGGAHFLPQTPYGGQSALGYQAGGGADIIRHRGRIAFRAEMDAVGTQFFHSYQISPKLTAGVVFSF